MKMLLRFARVCGALQGVLSGNAEEQARQSAKMIVKVLNGWVEASN